MYPQFKKIVLMASRLTPEKDIQTGIKAFLSARKKNPEIGLIIVGSGSEEKKIKKSDSVIHLPWADYPTLISYMKTCEIFMSTSLYEGYGLSMLEAHTTGATLVATDAGIAPELSFVVAKSGDVNQISSLLSKALDGHVQNKFYVYQYISKRSYLEAYKKDIERVLI
jgi:glycosyltransferase involved in cell wall biosynthesis